MAGFVCPHIAGLDAVRQRIRRLALVPVTEVLRLRLNRGWEAGADAFIRAAIRRVLVDTGMSAATFFPLSRAINRVQAEATIQRHINTHATSGPRRGIPTFPSGHHRPGFRDIEEGNALGERAFIFQVPQAGARAFVYRFSFQTVAFQHAIHEDGPQMRQSLEIGIQAFREAIQIRFIRDARLVVRDYFRGRTLAAQGIV